MIRTPPRLPAFAIPIALTEAGGLLLLEQHHAAPGLLRLGSLRVGEQSEEAHHQRKPFQFRGGMQHRTDVDRLPSALLEECRSIFRSEFQRRSRLSQRRSDLLLQHSQKRGRNEVGGPALKRWRRREVAAEGADFVGGEVDDQPLADDQRSLCRASQLLEKLAARSLIRQIQRNALQPAYRLLALENLVLV